MDFVVSRACVAVLRVDRVAAVTAAAIDGSAPGFRPLGEADFVNVNGDDDTWTWKDGVAHCTGQPVGVIRSKEKFTNFELVGTRLLRICPCCNELQDKAYELTQEQATLREQCPKCGFHFPYLTEQPSSFAVFKDVVPDAPGDVDGAEPAARQVGEPVPAR